MGVTNNTKFNEKSLSEATCLVGLVQSGLHHRHQHFIEYNLF